MPRGGSQPNTGRKPVPNGRTICWTLQQSTIELVKAEAKRRGKTPVTPDCEGANDSGRVRRGRYSGGWLSWFWGVKSNVVLGVPRTA